MAGVNTYKDGVVARLYKGLQGLVKSRKHHRTSRARAGSSAPTAVEVDGTTLHGHARRAGHRLVRPRRCPAWRSTATGSSPATTRCKLDYVPASVIVLGGGVIGVEFASVWKSFGADVTIVEALPHLVPARGRGQLQAAGAGLPQAQDHLQARRPVRRRRAHRRPASRSPSRTARRIEAELLLVAVGRGPVSAGPRLRGGRRRRWTAASSSSTSYCRTNVADDLRGRRPRARRLQLAHVGFGEGIFVAEQIAGLNPRADRLRRRPARHLLRARGRLGRPHRGRRPRRSTAPTRSRP